MCTFFVGEFDLNIDIILKELNKQLQIAYKKNEVPVSAIIAKDNKILAKTHNLRETKQDIMAHAEILCIKKAAKKLNNWNLSDCDLYVSLKPCSMCWEVIKQARIRSVFYFLDKPDFKHEYDGTDLKLLTIDDFSKSYQQLLKKFFKNRRK